MRLSRVWCSWSTDNRANAEYFFTQKQGFDHGDYRPHAPHGNAVRYAPRHPERKTHSCIESAPNADATQDL